MRGLCADVAQLVEQRFRKAKVGGSIPLIGFEHNVRPAVKMQAHLAKSR